MCAHKSVCVMDVQEITSTDARKFTAKFITEQCRTVTVDHLFDVKVIYENVVS